ncbi:two-component system sensor kinase/response regulator [Streptomyces lincolnensis]|uniref:PAS domain-containing protein n=1 Tax=Streptomyces lincolnensis TaxID=1915 RepID=UPI0009A10EF9|nr:PAS domain-containing protein [Streptomyces lincolnensis]AXG55260.1 two-component system sensor kinase/response regulator [Streptomyces lincolnensis]QMV08224.1 PAS domain-containing protein [Streptomyces lincolnensis]
MSSRPSRGAARLAAILDALPDALVLVNANGTVVNANTIALEAFEAPGTALVGRGLLDLLPQFDSKLIPGSMRRPDHMDPRGRTKPTRMVARRTDGTEFPVEVTSANLENGQQAYDSYGYGSDELLMLVVRDLTGTVDTEAELARSQRQTEMILRAASEGVVGTDTDGRIVLVNPAAAQILGYRASDLGGRELHDLVLHSRADGTPFSYEESPLADTLRSGRKHRVRGQVLWSKKGEKVPVDLTTAPVRDGDQLVGAVLTFTDRRPYDALAEEKETVEKRHAAELERLSEEHASELTALRQKHVTELEDLQEQHEEELAAGEERYAALGEREKDRYEALSGRYEQLLTLLAQSLRGPLDELRRELSALAADDAGQLWPEANQVLHHLSAGYSRITTLIDNVLGYQRIDNGTAGITRTKVMLDAVVAAGVDGAVELIGPGRVQFAVHAPPIEAEVDPRLLATALAHLVADVAGVDATGNAPVSAGGYMDNTVVVAAAQRGEVVRIEVRGPYAGGDPVHEPIVRGIVRAHGGVLQTHEVPGMSGSAYVLEVPIGGGAGAVAAPGPAALEAAGAQTAPPAPPVSPEQAGGGRRRARRSSTDAFLDAEQAEHADGEGAEADPTAPTGRRRRRAAAQTAGAVPAQAAGEAGDGSGGTGRRRGRPAEGADMTGDGMTGEDGDAGAGVSEGAVVTAAEHAAGTAAVGSGLGGTVPPQGVPAPGGRRTRPDGGEQHALPPALPAVASGDPAQAQAQDHGPDASVDDPQQPTGRRRRALAAASERAAAQEAGPRAVFALPPAAADRPDADPAQVAQAQAQMQAQVPGQAQAPAQVPVQVPGQGGPGDAPVDDGRHDAVPSSQADDHTPPQPHPTNAPTGRRRRAVGQRAETEAPGAPAQEIPAQGTAVPAAGAVPVQAGVPQPGVPQARAAQTAQTAPPGQAVTAGQGGQQVQPGQPVQPGQSVQPGAPVVAPGATVHGVQMAPGLQVPAQAAAGQAVPAQGTAAPAPGGPVPVSAQGMAGQPMPGQVAPGQQAAVPGQVLPNQALPAEGMPNPSGAGQPLPAEAAPGQQPGVPGQLAVPGQPVAPVQHAVPGQMAPGQAVPAQGPAAPGAAAPGTPAQGPPAPQPWPGTGDTSGAETPVPPNGAATPVNPQAPAGPVPPQGMPATVPPNGPVPPNGVAPPATQNPQAQTPQAPAPGAPLPPEAGAARARAAQPLPAEAAAEAPVDPNSTQGRAISVRTLGQGVPFTRQAQATQQTAPAPHPPHPSTSTPPPGQPGGSGRRRKLGTRPDPAAGQPEQAARPHPTAEQNAVPAQAQPQPQHSLAGQSRLAQVTEGTGRSYAIGAPDENAAEGPEPLDGPGGAVEVADTPRPQPMDDELPPEPLDNPRRLLVWPAPDVTTQQALSDRGYRPVIVHSREEVDAQIAAFPAALFVDPLTGPITRTALQSLRQAAVAAEVPVLVTAGLGQASREAAYGADPAVLLKALAPRDSEQHPPRVLLIEEHAEIALALTATLERRGMQVARAASDTDAVTLAGQLRPNLVVMDLMQVHKRRAGILDWLRANGQLNRTPLVVYTAAVDQADLPRLASGETVLFLAERSTSAEVQSRIVDLLARIGTN